MPRIYANGDSITTGLWDTQAGGWVERLKAHVMQRYMDPATVVTNLARSNQTLDRIVQRLPGILDTYDQRPSLGIFMLGCADAIMQKDSPLPQNPLENFRTQLPQLGSLLMKYQVTPIFVGLYPVDEALAHEQSPKGCHFSNVRNEGYEDAVRQYAATTAKPFVDLRTSPTRWGNLLSYDGLHPSAEGHAFIASLMATVVDQRLAEPPLSYGPAMSSAPRASA